MDKQVRFFRIMAKSSKMGLRFPQTKMMLCMVPLTGLVIARLEKSNLFALCGLCCLYSLLTITPSFQTDNYCLQCFSNLLAVACMLLLAAPFHLESAWRCSHLAFPRFSTMRCKAYSVQFCNTLKAELIRHTGISEQSTFHQRNSPHLYRMRIQQIWSGFCFDLRKEEQLL